MIPLSSKRMVLVIIQWLVGIVISMTLPKLSMQTLTLRMRLGWCFQEWYGEVNPRNGLNDVGTALPLFQWYSSLNRLRQTGGMRFDWRFRLNAKEHLKTLMLILRYCIQNAWKSNGVPQKHPVGSPGWRLPLFSNKGSFMISPVAVDIVTARDMAVALMNFNLPVAQQSSVNQWSSA